VQILVVPDEIELDWLCRLRRWGARTQHEQDRQHTRVQHQGREERHSARVSVALCFGHHDDVVFLVSE
jgi:hypothetical protein